ncbi:TPA: TetR/AcrR family transcriptional regulator [Streptococcus agalactiae]|nr:TetR/AcrR family transcriptional regulator [Streptococcus agalactiae]
MTESVTVNKKRIKQITQTQEDILTAFGQLLEEYPYEKIQISQIAKKSGYARRTLYRHFDSRDDLLTLFIERLTLNLFKQLGQLEQATFSQVFQNFFSYWSDYKSLLLILRKNDLLPQFQQSWFRHIDLIELGRGDLSFNTYAQRFAIGGIFSVLIEWIHQDCQTSIEELTQVSFDIINHLKNKKELCSSLNSYCKALFVINSQIITQIK